jgi:hypothetical protein
MSSTSAIVRSSSIAIDRGAACGFCEALVRQRDGHVVRDTLGQRQLALRVGVGAA